MPTAELEYVDIPERFRTVDAGIKLVRLCEINGHGQIQSPIFSDTLWLSPEVYADYCDDFADVCLAIGLSGFLDRFPNIRPSDKNYVVIHGIGSNIQGLSLHECKVEKMIITKIVLHEDVSQNQKESFEKQFPGVEIVLLQPAQAGRRYNWLAYDKTLAVCVQSGTPESIRRESGQLLTILDFGAFLKETFENGQTIGLMKGRDKNGIIEISQLNGENHGSWRKIDCVDGIVQAVHSGEFNCGVKDGVEKSFYGNTAIDPYLNGMQVFRRYFNGLPHGSWRFDDQSGAGALLNFDRGELHGTCRIHYTSGITVQLEFERGVLKICTVILSSSTALEMKLPLIPTI